MSKIAQRNNYTTETKKQLPDTIYKNLARKYRCKIPNLAFIYTIEGKMATIMHYEEFLSYYRNNSPQIMWLLGAGASARAGVKTAGEIIWDLKKEIYCRTQSVDINFANDIDRPAFRRDIQGHLDSQEGFPQKDSEEEYSFYLEYVHPTEEARRDYLNDVVLRGNPSLGHYVLAALGNANKAEIIWTTNFDGLVEKAFSELFGKDHTLYKCSVSEADDIQNHINKRNYPLLVKLHGDYQYKKLANTSSELASQNKYLKEGLLEAVRTRGLALVGYSGRDESIIQELKSGMAEGKGYPFGLYWFLRRGEEPHKSLLSLAAEAKKHSINFQIIEVDAFDQLFGDVFDLEGSISEDVRERIYSQIPRYEPPAIPLPSDSPGTVFPIIRTNALPILEHPTKALVLKAEVGGKREINQKIAESNADVVAFRRKRGVIALGNETELKKAFGAYEVISNHHISLSDIRQEMQELGFLYELLEKAISKNFPLLQVTRSRDSITIVIPEENQNNELFNSLKAAIKQANNRLVLRGTIPGTTINWAESLKCKIVTIQDNVYLLIKPTLVAPIPRELRENEALQFAVGEFINKQLQPRYNKKYSDILNEWITILCGSKNAKKKLLVFNEEEPFFEIQGTTAFSNKARILSSTRKSA